MLARGGLAMAAAAVLAATAGSAETMDELYAKAKPEGHLVLYGGGPVEPFERWAKEFEQKFPGLSVSVTARTAPLATGYSAWTLIPVDAAVRLRILS